MQNLDQLELEFENESKIKGARIGMLAHFLAFVGVTTLLVTINLVLVPETIWFIFPMLGMSIGVIMHYIFGMHLLQRRLRTRA
jgi:hypothetical protein